MKLTCALMAGFVEKQHSWVGVFTCTLDGHPLMPYQIKAKLKSPSMQSFALYLLMVAQVLTKVAKGSKIGIDYWTDNARACKNMLRFLVSHSQSSYFLRFSHHESR